MPHELPFHSQQGWNDIRNYVANAPIPSTEPNAEVIAASSWVNHPQYDRRTVVNDIAIVTLSRATAKRPALLDLTGAHAGVGWAGIALGFGSTLAVSPSDTAYSLPYRLMVRVRVTRRSAE